MAATRKSAPRARKAAGGSLAGGPAFFPELHLSIEQVAMMFSVHANTVRNWIANGTLPEVVQVGLVVRVPVSSVNALVERHRVRAAGLPPA